MLFFNYYTQNVGDPQDPVYHERSEDKGDTANEGENTYAPYRQRSSHG
jgi:hypothetical protein